MATKANKAKANEARYRDIRNVCIASIQHHLRTATRAAEVLATAEGESRTYALADLMDQVDAVQDIVRSLAPGRWQGEEN